MVVVDVIVGSLDGALETICVVLPHFFFIISILLIIHLFVAECKDVILDKMKLVALQDVVLDEVELVALHDVVLDEMKLVALQDVVLDRN